MSPQRLLSDTHTHSLDDGGLLWLKTPTLWPIWRFLYIHDVDEIAIQEFWRDWMGYWRHTILTRYFPSKYMRAMPHIGVWVWKNAKLYKVLNRLKLWLVGVMFTLIECTRQISKCVFYYSSIKNVYGKRFVCKLTIIDGNRLGFFPKGNANFNKMSAVGIL